MSATYLVVFELVEIRQVRTMNGCGFRLSKKRRFEISPPKMSLWHLRDNSETIFPVVIARKGCCNKPGLDSGISHVSASSRVPSSRNSQPYIS
jgi:hypothetical protein